MLLGDDAHVLPLPVALGQWSQTPTREPRRMRPMQLPVSGTLTSVAPGLFPVTLTSAEQAAFGKLPAKPEGRPPAVRDEGSVLGTGHLDGDRPSSCRVAGRLPSSVCPSEEETGSGGGAGRSHGGVDGTRPVLRVPGRPQPCALQSADSLCGRRGDALLAGAPEPASKTARCVTCGPCLPGQPQVTSEERPHKTR